jgi:hypothetical protein
MRTLNPYVTHASSVIPRSGIRLRGRKYSARLQDGDHPFPQTLIRQDPAVATVNCCFLTDRIFVNVSAEANCVTGSKICELCKRRGGIIEMWHEGISGQAACILQWRAINPLKPSGYYMYHRVSYAKTLHSAHRVYMSVPYGSHSKQRLSP